jgi:hypothetical protein
MVGTSCVGGTFRGLAAAEAATARGSFGGKAGGRAMATVTMEA